MDTSNIVMENSPATPPPSHTTVPHTSHNTPTTSDSKEPYFPFKQNFPMPEFNVSDQLYGGVGVGGYRSPCSSLQQYQGMGSPPGHGRSVRGFEEQMATLRKENFNLKLRLYFMEESMPGYQQANAANCQETLSKQLVEAKIEMEMLRKDIQEKQDILKEAAQAMNQMEQIQKDTELKSQAIVDELKEKIQYLEMERDVDNSPNSPLMNDLFGNSEINENIDAVQKISQLENVIKQCEVKTMDDKNQITELNKMVAQRDETIKEYEEKVKELAFQNAEILETLENIENEKQHLERALRNLRISNTELREDNKKLTAELNSMQNNIRSEMSNMKLYENRMRDQQEVLSKMHSTITIKSQNTARLLERIQEYEKMVTKINFERNLAKRENRFFRAIIGKLQDTNTTRCYTTIEKEFYQQIGSDDLAINAYQQSDPSFLELRARGDYRHEYKLHHKFRLKYPKMSNTSLTSSEGNRSGGGDIGGSCIGAVNYLQSYCDVASEIDPEIPIRYTISDMSIYGRNDLGNTDSCSSLNANMSSSSILAGSSELQADQLFIKEQHIKDDSKKHPQADGIRFIYSKFGNFQ